MGPGIRRGDPVGGEGLCLSRLGRHNLDVIPAEAGDGSKVTVAISGPASAQVATVNVGSDAPWR